MAKEQRKYDKEYKIQAVKLSKEIGSSRALADAMMEIQAEDECNDTYGRVRMRQVLLLKKPEGVSIPNERTVYWVMARIGLCHRPKRKPNGITKADREARKSDDLNGISLRKIRCGNALPISRKSRQKTGNYMFPQSLTALTTLFWAWQWRIICGQSCASALWTPPVVMKNKPCKCDTSFQILSNIKLCKKQFI